MPRDSFVFVQNGGDVLFLQSFKDGRGFGGNLKHRLGGSVVWLHASKIPAAKLVQINHSIMVQVQVFECLLKLPLRQRGAQVPGQISQFLQVDGAAAVRIKLVESSLDFLLSFLFVLSSELLHGHQERSDSFGRLLWQVGILLSAEPLVQMIHQEVE